MDTTKNFYLDLEQKLYNLRVHFSMCKDLKNDDVLEWAKFFLEWSREAKKHCGDWGLENLKHAENAVKNLEKSKIGVTGLEALERAMGEAAQSLSAEILSALKQGEGTKNLFSSQP